MGYPMTWQRLINRNRLTDGDYETTPKGWVHVAPTTAWDVAESMSKEALIACDKTVQQHQHEEADRKNGQMRLFAGDLRRLERDTLDEGYICREIARRTGLEPDDVAAVLKEWLAV